MEQLYVAERIHQARLAELARRHAARHGADDRPRRVRFDARLGLVASLLLAFRAG